MCLSPVLELASLLVSIKKVLCTVGAYGTSFPNDLQTLEPGAPCICMLSSHSREVSRSYITFPVKVYGNMFNADNRPSDQILTTETSERNPLVLV